MFFVFHFLVFAYFMHSEINCSTQENVRATNYVKEREEISNYRGAVQFKGANHKTNKRTDLKSNVYDKILTDEMLSMEHRHNVKDSSEFPSYSSKHHVVTPTLEIKQKWPMIKHINNANDVVRRDNNKNIGSKTTLLQKIIENDDDYLDPLSKPELTSKLKLEANKLEDPYDVLISNKVSGIKSEIYKPSKGNAVNNKVIGMRSLQDNGVKSKCTCSKSNPSSTCNSCAGNRNNKKRCTHSTPNGRTHECSRNGVVVTNHSCQGQQFQSQPGLPFQSQPVLITSNPYSFYPVYFPYSYFASERPMIPYKVNYPQPNLISDLKIPRKHKHKCKSTTRFDDDLYYEDNDSHERRPYDENEYYQDSKKGSTKVDIVYDVNQDTLIKEIVKDLKIHNNKDFVKECYCDSSSSLFSGNIFVLIMLLSCFAL